MGEIPGRMDPKKDHHLEDEVEEEALEVDSGEASLVVVVVSAAAEEEKEATPEEGVVLSPEAEDVDVAVAEVEEEAAALIWE